MECQAITFEESFYNLLNRTDSFEYLCYGSTAIIHILILTVRGSTLDVRIWRL